MLFIIVDMFWIFDVLFLYFWAGSPINRSKRHSTKEVAFQEYVELHLLHDILGGKIEPLELIILVHTFEQFLTKLSCSVNTEIWHTFFVIVLGIYGFSNEVPGVSFLLFSFKFPFLIRRLLRMRIVINSTIAMQFLEVMVIITWLTHYLTCFGFLISRDSTPFGDRNANLGMQCFCPWQKLYTVFVFVSEWKCIVGWMVDRRLQWTYRSVPKIDVWLSM